MSGRIASRRHGPTLYDGTAHCCSSRHGNRRRRHSRPRGDQAPATCSAFRTRGTHATGVAALIEAAHVSPRTFHVQGRSTRSGESRQATRCDPRGCQGPGGVMQRLAGVHGCVSAHRPWTATGAAQPDLPDPTEASASSGRPVAYRRSLTRPPPAPPVVPSPPSRAGLPRHARQPPTPRRSAPARHCAERSRRPPRAARPHPARAWP